MEGDWGLLFHHGTPEVDLKDFSKKNNMKIFRIGISLIGGAAIYAMAALLIREHIYIEGFFPNRLIFFIAWFVMFVGIMLMCLFLSVLVEKVFKCRAPN